MFLPVGGLPLGGFPEEYVVIGSHNGRIVLGRYGRVRRVEDEPLILEIPFDEDFDLDMVMALYEMRERNDR